MLWSIQLEVHKKVIAAKEFLFFSGDSFSSPRQNSGGKEMKVDSFVLIAMRN